MRQPLQSPFTNNILHYITYDKFQRLTIEDTALIFGGLNIKIITDNSSTLPPLFPCPKITLFLEILMCRPILLKAMCE